MNGTPGKRGKICMSALARSVLLSTEHSVDRRWWQSRGCKCVCPRQAHLAQERIIELKDKGKMMFRGGGGVFCADDVSRSPRNVNPNRAVTPAQPEEAGQTRMRWFDDGVVESAQSFVLRHSMP